LCGRGPESREVDAVVRPYTVRETERDLEVPDPYEWPGDGFESVYQMLDTRLRWAAGPSFSTKRELDFEQEPARVLDALLDLDQEPHGLCAVDERWS
jgi:hypothetical protein